MTEKLYYKDSHIHEFTAVVTGCREYKNGFAVTLDRTAFFPEGGGQLADTGTIGAARVSDVHEKDGEILHYTDMALPAGESLKCSLDYEQRRRRMQNHSGEHVVSGLTHSLYGLNNVGFHMGAECMTIDFDGELGQEELTRIETLANQAVRDNVPISTSFPDRDTLAALDYRSKLELTGEVRIVRVEGIDCCACCAPHVAQTGEIGLIKILDAERHRGGVRISLVCGMDALDNYRRRQDSVAAISALLSAKRDETAKAVERVLGEQERLKEKIAGLSMELVRLRAAGYEYRPGNICVFDTALDEIAQRELINLLMEKCSGYAALFCGNDGDGYRYIIGSRSVDLRAMAKSINAGIAGKGGGTSSMIQGRAAAEAEIIQKFVETISV